MNIIKIGRMIVMKNKNKLLLVAGIGAVVGYRAIRGKGIFNKLRFKKQYDAILSYRDTHFPEASIGEIFPLDEGWGCNILYNEESYLLYLIPAENGGYIFSQTKM